VIAFADWITITLAFACVALVVIVVAILAFISRIELFR
jgi:hypothetical protein